MSSDCYSVNQLKDWFWCLDEFLLTHQTYWRERPFNHLTLGWEAQAPELSQWLRAQSLEHAECYQAAPEQLTQAPAPFAELAQRSAALSQVKPFLNRALQERPVYISRDVPGRKWQQIQHFAKALKPQNSLPWLDWCAGKGHLARYLAWPDHAFTCLEYDAALVKSGQKLTDKLNLPGQHHCQDVMQAKAANWLGDHFAVALHACGDLHRQLLSQAVNSKTQQLALAPCCYNRTRASGYQALSSTAQGSQLQLSKDDLALPLQTTVTANSRETTQRDQSMAWRLAFDLYQRRVRKVDQYLTTPALASYWWKKPFMQWCQDLADLKQVEFVANTNWQQLEHQGWQRLAQVRNLELVQALFKRPLELWLVLDLALYLSESGYEVALGSFCSAQLTPRNLLLQAIYKKQ